MPYKSNFQSLVARYTVHRDDGNNQEHTICVDAAFCDENHSYATGYVIYDPVGILKAVGFRKIKPTGSILAAEVHAIYNSLVAGIVQVQGLIRIFSDSVDAIHSIYSKKKYNGVEEIHIERTIRLIDDFSVIGV